MSLENKLVLFVQAVGADIKQLRINDGDLTSLTTSAKTSLVAAINELKSSISGAGAVIDDAAGDGDDDVVWSADKTYNAIADAISALAFAAIDDAAGDGDDDVVWSADKTYNAIVDALGDIIDDTAGTGDTDVTWSADKIGDELLTAINDLRDELVNGAGTALDTLGELAAALGNDASFSTTVATALGNRVRYDAAQSLTTAQKLQARTNIDAVFTTDVGDTERDLVSVYTTAKT